MAYLEYTPERYIPEPKHIYKELVYKRTCPKVMKDWINFCRYHHGYSIEKLEKFFPEYVEIN